MSYISNALKKVQDSRQNDQRQMPEKIVYLTDVPETWPKTALRIFLVVSIVITTLISITAMILTMRSLDSKQIEQLSLEKNIRTQDKRMNDLITIINKNEKTRNVQILELNSRLNKENSDIKDRIINSISSDNEHYSNLKEALLNDQENINLLENEIKVLDQKIEAMSVSNAQPQVVTSPASGN